MRAAFEAWRAMPRQHKIEAVIFPPVFIAMLWAFYVIMPN
jgi:hypothetical protein